MSGVLGHFKATQREALLEGSKNRKGHWKGPCSFSEGQPRELFSQKLFMDLVLLALFYTAFKSS